MCTCHIMKRCGVSTPHLDRREWPASHFSCYTYYTFWIRGWTGLGSHTYIIIIDIRALANLTQNDQVCMAAGLKTFLNNFNSRHT